jgi:hypothetical protein
VGDVGFFLRQLDPVGLGASWLTVATIEHPAESVGAGADRRDVAVLLSSIVAGALADTNDRRLLMLVSQSVMLVASVLLAGLTWFGVTTPLLLLGMTFILGCGSAPSFAPAWQSSIGDQVPRAQVPAAIMANAMGFNLARSVGPAIGGVIVAALGAVMAFVINAISYLGMLATLLWWKPPRTKSVLPPESLGSAILAGVRYVRFTDLLAIYLRCVMFTVPFSAVNALMPVVARDLLGGTAQTFGSSLGGFGVGAMCVRFERCVTTKISGRSLVARRRAGRGDFFDGDRAESVGDHDLSRARARRGHVDHGARELQHRRADVLAALGDGTHAGDLSNFRLCRYGGG